MDSVDIKVANNVNIDVLLHCVDDADAQLLDYIGNFIKGLNAVDTEELLHGVHDADA